MAVECPTHEAEHIVKFKPHALHDLYGLVVKYGFVLTSKSILSDWGFSLFSKVRYPVKDMEFVVRSGCFWKDLQEGRWELQVLRAVANLAREGDTIIDAGAWIGPYTLLLSRLIGDHGLVCSFEPDPVARAKLSDSVKRNHLSNIRTEACCLTNHIGSVVLKSDRFGGSGGTIVDQEWMKNPRQVVVPATTIDAYCKLNGLKPHGVKIDVEGAEGLVLEGMLETIRECRPWVLLEFHNCYMSHETKRNTWEILTNEAREVTYIDGRGSSHKSGDIITTAPTDEVAHLLVRY